MNKLDQRQQTIGEEIFNSVLHGIGVLLSIAGLVILIVLSALQKDAWKVVSFSIYGTSLILLYLSSTLHHSLTHKGAKALFLIFDHSSIYLLIAGTYTPFMLVMLRDSLGWVLFGGVWGIAVFGIVFKAFFTGRYEAVSLVLYLVMGWLITLVFGELAATISRSGLVFLIVGGAVYSLGIIFYVLDRFKFMHTIWHFFVIGGSVCHYFSMLTGVLPY